MGLCPLLAQDNVSKSKNVTSTGLSFDLPGTKEVTFSAQYELEKGSKKGRVSVTATMSEGWHTFSTTQAKGGPKPSKIVCKNDFLKLSGPFQSDRAPNVGAMDIWPGLPLEEFHDRVTWTALFELTRDFEPERSAVDLAFDGQACNIKCVEVKEKFSALFAGFYVPSENQSEAANTTIGFPKLPSISLTAWHIFAAILGGFLLNFMPCVLPVVGLKLLSFVSQAGSNRMRVVSLNLSFVGGILSVMLLLAAVTIIAKLCYGQAFGWGQQFERLDFQVALATLVFAMALSFLGVWEIPVPGFATSSKSGELMEKEGHLGAFLKGVLTTVLATPCSGPFLGALFGLTLGLSPFGIVVLYVSLGIGLGLPYLALCAYPGFVKLLPKPGAWMETLKQVLAFPLLLTVVYLVQVVDPDYRIAMLIVLVAVGFACWMIGRLSPMSESKIVRSIWLYACATVTVAGLVGFNLFGPVTHLLPWEPYNEAQLTEYQREGKTVMVEFTARWCPTCQTNMLLAIDVEQVAQVCTQNNVITMLADKSRPSPHIDRKLEQLGSTSIPLLVIYPPDGKPIVLRDTITQSKLIDALEHAGPSRM